MLFNTKRSPRKTTRQTLSTEQLEPKAMFSVSPVEPVVALDVGPVNQAGYDCTNAGTCSAEGFMKIGDIKGEVKPTERVGNDGRSIVHPQYNVGEDGRMIVHPQYNVGEETFTTGAGGDVQTCNKIILVALLVLTCQLKKRFSQRMTVLAVTDIFMTKAKSVLMFGLYYRFKSW